MANKRRVGINIQKASETKMAKALDDMADFEDYRENVLPKLRKAVKEKWSVEKIYKEFGALIAAKVITTALTDPDSGRALTAAKEALDRSMGKAKERIETTQKYEKLTDNELDNLLESTLNSVVEEGTDESERKH
jgi:uncharacterized protein YabN with tetrapyrrole methylase and pyrophosphatase domain